MVDKQNRRQEPIRIQFLDLDAKYWSASNLSKVGGMIGKPIEMDKATKNNNVFCLHSCGSSS